MRRKAYVIFLAADTAMILVLLALDQFTKHLAAARLKDSPAFVLVEGILELQYCENRGVAFSMFQDQKFFILCLGGVMLAVLLFFLFRLPAERKFLTVHVMLAALIAGALGNMADRIRLGYVVDFIYFKLINFPVFNFADCLIVVSVILMALLFLFVYKEEDWEWTSSVLK